MWDVIWKIRFRFVFCWNYLWWFVLVIMLDHFIVSFFWLSNLAFDEWRMLILDYRVTYVCSRFVERRLWRDVIKFDEKSHQIHCERFIKFDEKDSSRLTTSFHQTWLKQFIKLDDVISSNLTKIIHQTRQMISHQTRRRFCLFFQINVLEW
jgi:hypothetical protein